MTILERHLEDRGYLKFFFETGQSPRDSVDNLRQPTNGAQSSPNFIVKIPFFENPEIRESKQARLGKYKPIGRNSNLYSFLGSDSRVVTLSFNMTLQHLNTVIKSRALDDYITKPRSSMESKGKISFDPDELNKHTTSISKILAVITDYEYDFLRISERNMNFSPSDTKLKALYYFWTNVIRCSVVGRSDHRGPPPTVRLNFGPLYKGVPFVVERYEIQIDDKAGYDLTTLLPNRLKINMTMEELRVGNFGEYNPMTPNYLDGENVAGWEYLESTGSLDPVFSPVNELGLFDT